MDKVIAALTPLAAIAIIGALEAYALKLGHDGMLFATSVGLIGLVVGVKAKSIRDILSTRK